MIDYERSLLVVLLLTTGISAYTDVKYGKVKNVLLISSVLAALPIQIEGIICGVIALPDFMISVVCISLFAILFYLWGYWAAGDCKLLMSISMIFPHTLYWDLMSPLSKALSLLVFFMAVTYGYVLIDTIFNVLTEYRTLVLTWKRTVNQKTIVDFAKKWWIFVFFANAVSLIGNTVFQLPFMQIAFFSFLICTTLGNWTNKIKPYWPTVMLLDIAYWVLSGLSVADVGKVIITAIISFGFGKAIQVFNYKIIDLNKLSPGMIVSALTINEIRSQCDSSFLDEKADEHLLSRISIEDVEMIKATGIDKIRIVRKIPFAFFISVGTLLYLAVKLYYANCAY